MDCFSGLSARVPSRIVQVIGSGTALDESSDNLSVIGK